MKKQLTSSGMSLTAALCSIQYIKTICIHRKSCEPIHLTLIYMTVGRYDAHSFEWPFLLKFLCTKIV